MSLKSDADLRKLYSRLDANKETVVYCQSGVRAADGRGCARQARLPQRQGLRFHPGSVTPAKLDAPVENEVFFNVGALRAQLTAMQSKIDALEKALAAMRAPEPK